MKAVQIESKLSDSKTLIIPVVGCLSSRDGKSLAQKAKSAVTNADGKISVKCGDATIELALKVTDLISANDFFADLQKAWPNLRIEQIQHEPATVGFEVLAFDEPAAGGMKHVLIVSRKLKKSVLILQPYLFKLDLRKLTIK